MRSSGSPNQHLPDNLRLDAGFVSALTGDYGLARDENGSWHIGETMDLSVLMRFTDPPTEVAVDIARNRLNPLLGTSYFDLPDEMSYSLVTDDPWGQYDDAVVNYATMLGRNDDAAAYYVASTGNDGQATLALVLDRPGHSDVDGGAALAALVQKGVTHDFLGSTVLNQAIDIIGRDGGIQEIKNPHMNDALAAGVAENMEVIERRALQDLGGDEFDARSPETLAAMTSCAR